MFYLTLTIIVFILVALGGIFMFTKILKDQRPPRSIAYVHGILGGAGYGLAVYYSFGTESTLMIAATIFLTLAILGGFTLFSIDTVKKKVPKAGAIIHGTAAVTGIIILIIYALGL